MLSNMHKRNSDMHKHYTDRLRRAGQALLSNMHMHNSDRSRRVGQMSLSNMHKHNSDRSRRAGPFTSKIVSLSL